MKRKKKKLFNIKKKIKWCHSRGGPGGGLLTDKKVFTSIFIFAPSGQKLSGSDRTSEESDTKQAKTTERTSMIKMENLLFSETFIQNVCLSKKQLQ